MGNGSEVTLLGGIGKFIKAPFKLLGNAGAGVVSLAQGDTEGFKNGIAGMGNSIFDAVEAPMEVAVGVLEVPKSILSSDKDTPSTSVEKITFGTKNAMDVPIGVVELGQDIVNSLRPERKGFFEEKDNKTASTVNQPKKNEPKKDNASVTSNTVQNTTSVTDQKPSQVTVGSSSNSNIQNNTPVLVTNATQVPAQQPVTKKTDEVQAIQTTQNPITAPSTTSGDKVTPDNDKLTTKIIDTKVTSTVTSQTDFKDGKAISTATAHATATATAEATLGNIKTTATATKTATATVTVGENIAKKDEEKKDAPVVVPLPLPVDTTPKQDTKPSNTTNDSDNDGTLNPVLVTSNDKKENSKLNYKLIGGIALATILGIGAFFLFKNRAAIWSGLKGLFGKTPKPNNVVKPTKVIKPEDIFKPSNQKLLTYTPTPPGTTPAVVPPSTTVKPKYITTKYPPLEERTCPLPEAERKKLKDKILRKIAIQEDKMWNKHEVSKLMKKQDKILSENIAEQAAKKASKADIQKQMDEMFAARKAELATETAKAEAKKAKEIEEMWAKHTPKKAKSAEVTEYFPSNHKPSKKVKHTSVKTSDIERTKQFEDALAKESAKSAAKAEAKKAKEIEKMWRQHAQEQAAATASAKKELEKATEKEIEEYIASLSTSDTTKKEAQKAAKKLIAQNSSKETIKQEIASIAESEKVTEKASKADIQKQMDEMFAKRKEQIAQRKARQTEAMWAEHNGTSVETVTGYRKPEIKVSSIPQTTATLKQEVNTEVQKAVSKKPEVTVTPALAKVPQENVSVGQKIRIRMKRNTPDKVVAQYKDVFATILGSKENAIRKHQFLAEIEVTPTNIGQIKKLYKYLDILAA